MLPWHGQLIVPSVTWSTVQPWWVQVAENASKVPALGWGITRSLAGKVFPPPTGLSVGFATGPAPGAGSAGVAGRGCCGPQAWRAVSAPVANPATAPRRE